MIGIWQRPKPSILYPLLGNNYCFPNLPFEKLSRRLWRNENSNFRFISLFSTKTGLDNKDFKFLLIKINQIIFHAVSMRLNSPDDATRGIKEGGIKGTLVINISRVQIIKLVNDSMYGSWIHDFGKLFWKFFWKFFWLWFLKNYRPHSNKLTKSRSRNPWNPIFSNRLKISGRDRASLNQKKCPRTDFKAPKF